MALWKPGYLTQIPRTFHPPYAILIIVPPNHPRTSKPDRSSLTRQPATQTLTHDNSTIKNAPHNHPSRPRPSKPHRRPPDPPNGKTPQPTTTPPASDIASHTLATRTAAKAPFDPWDYN